MTHYGPKATQAFLQAKELEAQGYRVWLAPEYLERLDIVQVDDWDFADMQDTLIKVERDGQAVWVESVGKRRVRLLKRDMLASALGETIWTRVAEFCNERLPAAETRLLKEFGGSSFEFGLETYRFDVIENGWFEDFFGTVRDFLMNYQESLSEAYYDPPLPFEVARVLKNRLSTRFV